VLLGQVVGSSSIVVGYSSNYLSCSLASSAFCLSPVGGPVSGGPQLDAFSPGVPHASDSEPRGFLLLHPHLQLPPL
jgi:hypothetical protein